MNTNARTASPSVDLVRKQPDCYDTDSINLIALGATADDRRDYLFHYGQFLHAELSANPELEEKPDAPPERLQICFATGQVVILGSGLSWLTKEIQKGSLKSVKRINQNYISNISDLRINVCSVTVILKEDV